MCIRDSLYADIRLEDVFQTSIAYENGACLLYTSGCSKSPIDLLKGAGVDMTSPEPVNQALQLFGELLDEMEQLVQD